MLNIKELEKRWLHYKIKTYIPHAVIVVSLLVILVVMVIVLNTSHQTLKKATLKIEPKVVQKVAKKSIVVVPTTPKLVEEKNTTNIVTITPLLPKSDASKQMLSPSMNFMHHIQSEEQQPFYKTLNTQKPPKKAIKRDKIVKEPVAIQEEYLDIGTKKKKKVAKTKSKIQQVVIKKPIKKTIITIKRRDSQKDIDDVIKRFDNNNNPALSLFVAKKYYELNDYEQAYNYSLITNGINNHIEDSWLIFAKSLVKLHKRDMAIKTLKEYISFSHSGNAKILLSDIQTGKFQ